MNTQPSLVAMSSSAEPNHALPLTQQAVQATEPQPATMPAPPASACDSRRQQDLSGL